MVVFGGRMKKLIVNADDFGWSTGVNRGVIDAHERGVLTSATLLVNFPAHADAAERSRACPGLGVGLHLNIVHGPPVSDPGRIPSLLGSDGAFPGPASVLRRLLLGRIKPGELEVELKAQLSSFRRVAGEPTHLDSHKHLHVFGCFTDAVASIAGEMRTPRARCPLPLLSPRAWKSRLLFRAGRRTARIFTKHGLRFPDALVGEGGISSLQVSTLCRMLEQLPDGVTELMCHPGYHSTDEHDVVSNVAVTATRQSDLDMLMDAELRSFISEQGVECIHYGGL